MTDIICKDQMSSTTQCHSSPNKSSVYVGNSELDIDSTIRNKLSIDSSDSENDILSKGGEEATVKNDAIVVEEKYYEDAKKYWSHISCTVDGMLGGFGGLTFPDIRASITFLQFLFKIKPSPGRQQALDCGAGIGRVTKNLLIQFYDKVDIAEQEPKFAQTAEETLRPTGHLGTVFNVGLQNFTPEAKKYDMIWAQWVLGHLKEDDLINFYRRCLAGLKKNGVMVIKENVTNANKIEIDEEDSSVTRPRSLMKKLIADAGFRIVRETKQHDMPKGMFPVYMFALKPLEK